MQMRKEGHNQMLVLILERKTKIGKKLVGKLLLLLNEQ